MRLLLITAIVGMGLLASGCTVVFGNNIFECNQVSNGTTTAWVCAHVGTFAY